ncbi:MAG TPA: hypothetical protein VEX86_20615 [Longimicrobium sp.]|nr:hypothetical protein [Longimicrobium sp.]
MEISEQDRARKRRSVVLMLVLAAATILVGVTPTFCTYVQQPQDYWKTYAEAPRTGRDVLPPQVPPSATEIHARRDDRSGRRWVRFTFAPADKGRVTAGLRRLTLNQARAVTVDGPTFSPWWTVNQRTMIGRAGQRVEAYEVPGSPRAWLFVDPASNAGFYWSVAE